MGKDLGRSGCLHDT